MLRAGCAEVPLTWGEQREKAEKRDGGLGGAGEEGGKLDLFLLLWRNVNAKCPHHEHPVLGQGLQCSLPVLWLEAELLLQGQEGEGSHRPCDFSFPGGKTQREPR